MFVSDRRGNKIKVESAVDRSGGLTSSVSFLYEDKVQVLARGEVFAVANYMDGTSETVVLGKNLVVNTAGNLVARLCRGYGAGDPTVPPDAVGISEGPVFGITHMALGTATPVDAPPGPDLGDTTLDSEYFRKSITTSSYVNEDGTESALPTRIVDFVTTFEFGEPEGQLTEIGLFGAVNNSGVPATTPDGGLLFARRTFPVWNINSTTSITFTWRIFF